MFVSVLKKVIRVKDFWFHMIFGYITFSKCIHFILYKIYHLMYSYLVIDRTYFCYSKADIKKSGKSDQLYI